MKILTEKELVNLTTERLNELRKKLIRIVASRRHEVDTGVATANDYKVLREYEDFYDMVRDVMSNREHLEPKRSRGAHDKRSRRDAISKKRNF